MRAIGKWAGLRFRRPGGRDGAYLPCHSLELVAGGSYPPAVTQAVSIQSSADRLTVLWCRVRPLPDTKTSHIVYSRSA